MKGNKFKCAFCWQGFKTEEKHLEHIEECQSNPYRKEKQKVKV